MKQLDASFFSYLKSERDKLFLWHDLGKYGALRAEQIAKDNNGKTLEMIMQDNIEALSEYGVVYDETKGIRYIGDDKEFWDRCSISVVDQASGEINEIKGNADREEWQGEAICERLEDPVARANPDIIGKNIIDHETGKKIGETEAFDHANDPEWQSIALNEHGQKTFVDGTAETEEIREEKISDSNGISSEFGEQLSLQESEDIDYYNGIGY